MNTENKRFMIDNCGELIDLNNHTFVEYGDEVCNLLNELSEENEQLKAQLYCNDEEGICNICKYHFLVSDDETEWGYYNFRCKKGHHECARISLKHCEDFQKGDM